MKKNLYAASAILLSCAIPFLSGCITSPVSVAPSTTPITANDVVTQIGPASGSAWGGWILFFPIGGGNVLEPALQRALAPTGADALVDVKVETHTYMFLIVGLTRTEIYGKAVKIIKGGATH